MKNFKGVLSFLKNKGAPLEFANAYQRKGTLLVFLPLQAETMLRLIR